MLDLQKKSDATQRATMLHFLGLTVQRIFSTLPGENTTLAATKDTLNRYFAPKRNVVAKRSLRKRVLQLAHETHQGVDKTKQFLRSRFCWPGMDEAAETMIKNCHACVPNKSLNKNVPLQPIKLPHGPWIKGAVDIIVPMDGKYILTYIDDYSSYPEVQVLKEITSSEVIGVRFGFPEETVSDNGKQFISAKFEAFLKSCEIRHVRASLYYVRSNGKVERFHRYLK